MGDILAKGTYTGHLTWNFVGEIRFSSLKEKVGQVVCLRQAYNQCGWQVLVAVPRDRRLCSASLLPS